MEIDRGDTGNEDVENTSSSDGRPPPPPDRPGTEGYPTRAGSRDGAVAASDSTDQRGSAETRYEKTGDTDTQSPADRDAPADQASDEEPGWVETLDDLPHGEELRDMDSEKLSRFERVRKEGYKKLNDALDVTHKGFDLGADAFARPPTHAETRAIQPHVVEAPIHGVTAGEAATGMLVAGVLLGELLRAGREKLIHKKEREDNASSR